MSYPSFEEMDSYFDFDQSFHDPTSPSGAFSSNLGTIDPNSILLHAEHGPQSQGFSGPSFEYNRYRQLTGLPSGAVSNVTEFNEINSVDYSFGSNFMDQTPFDMNMGYNGGVDFEIDFNSTTQEPLPSFLFSNENSPMGNMVSPNTLPIQPTPMPTSNARLWPGIHSQQAQQAKAAALARQQQQQQMGQQIMQQRHQELQQQQLLQRQQQQQQQQALPDSCRSSVSRQGGQQSSSAAAEDPVVEERISRLLDQMRNNSTVSSMEEDGSGPGGDEARIAKMKKDEEDMDEDERLLASEEGKKLSSKERRQLRNKVSARAFRSRRKEYITQLEGEVADKATECNELKARNRNLTDQNQQLTRLTQTLLRHPAFATFLNDMSNDPSLLEPTRNPNSANSNQSTDDHQMIPKKEDSHDTRINMAILPQTPLNLSMMNLGINHWDANFSFQQPQVFSILELPQGPLMIGVPNLSGKKAFGSDPEAAYSATSKANQPKLTRPCFPSVKASSVETKPFDATGIDEHDPHFALYIDSTSLSITSTPNASLPVSKSLCAKATTIKSTSNIYADDAAATQHVNTLFDNLSFHYDRVAALTAHLPL